MSQLKSTAQIIP